MPTFDRLAEVILYVEDIERMATFYTEVMGLDVTAGATEHGFVEFDTGTCHLCLHAGRDGDLGQYAPKVVFAVDDLEAARDHLVDHGVDIGEVRRPTPDIAVFDGRDPEGNKFSIEAAGAAG